VKRAICLKSCDRECVVFVGLNNFFWECIYEALGVKGNCEEPHGRGNQWSILYDINAKDIWLGFGM